MKYYAITSPEPIKIPTLPHQASSLLPSKKCLPHYLIAALCPLYNADCNPPQDLVQIMTACLSKDRQKRPTIIQLMGFKGTENMD